MKYAVVFLALFAVALALPLDDSKNAQILRYDNDNIGVEGYKWAYETSDGKSHNEEGELRNVGSEDEAIAVRGKFSYVDNEGNTFEVSYVADENGFQPQGAHLPQP